MRCKAALPYKKKEEKFLPLVRAAQPVQWGEPSHPGPEAQAVTSQSPIILYCISTNEADQDTLLHLRGFIILL